jgi:hypothetical protein
MKEQKKNRRGLDLRTRNNRWKWMAGATAASAAGVAASQATTITINLVNNYIGAADGNHLNADLTGDGHPDLTIANASHSYYFAGVILNGVRASFRYGNSGNFPTDFRDFGTVRLGSRHANFVRAFYGYNTTRLFGTPSLTGSIPIFFKDLHINGGAPTNGSLEVTVEGLNHKIQLDTFTYNTPDQGSSLVLLALGAGGVLAVRRWRAARAQS